jgi:hypothetical protein
MEIHLLESKIRIQIEMGQNNPIHFDWTIPYTREEITPNLSRVKEAAIWGSREGKISLSKLQSEHRFIMQLMVRNVLNKISVARGILQFRDDHKKIYPQT